MSRKAQEKDLSDKEVTDIYIPAKTTRSERIQHRQNLIAAQAIAAATADLPKRRVLTGQVRKWERRWVQVSTTMKALRWVPKTKQTETNPEVEKEGIIKTEPINITPSFPKTSRPRDESTSAEPESKRAKLEETTTPTTGTNETEETKTETPITPADVDDGASQGQLSNSDSVDNVSAMMDDSTGADGTDSQGFVVLPQSYENYDPTSAMEVANSTAGAAVYRADGTRLYGMDAELELKMQSKRDPEFEKSLLQWVEQVAGDKAIDINDFGESLKSGVLLCKLVNSIEPNSVKKIDTRNIALVHVENINAYLKACWNIGLPNSELFITSDLFGKKGIPQVVQNVNGMAKLAMSKPNYKGPSFGATPKINKVDIKPAKKWESVSTTAKTVYVEDLEAAAAASGPSNAADAAKIVELQRELESIRSDLKREQLDRQSIAQRESAMVNESKQMKEKINVAEKKNGQLVKEVETSKGEANRLKQEVEQYKNTVEQYKVSLEKQKRETMSIQTSPVPSIPTIDPILHRQIQDRVVELEAQVAAEKKKKKEYKSQMTKAKKELEAEREAKRDLRQHKQATITHATLRRAKLDQPEPEPAVQDEIDNLSHLNSVLRRIFVGKEAVVVSDYGHLNELLKDELSRRYYAKQLTKQLKTTAHYELPMSSFECIVFLTTTCLRELQAESHPDFISCRHIMRASNKIMAKESEQSVLFLRDYTRDFDIYSSSQFWHDCFIEELNRKYRRFFPMESNHNVDVDFVATLCSSFILQMGEWKAKDNMIDTFITDILYNNHVGLSNPKELQSRMENFWVESKFRARASVRASTVIRTHSSSSPPTPVKMPSQGSGIAASPELSRKSKLLSVTGDLRDSKARKYTVTKEVRGERKENSQRFQIPPGTVIRSGNLNVKATLWKQKLVTLKQNYIVVTKDAKASKAEVILPLYYGRVANSDKKSHGFVVGDPTITNKDLFLAATSDRDRDEWVAAIRLAIEMSQTVTEAEGANTSFTQIPGSPRIGSVSLSATDSQNSTVTPSATTTSQPPATTTSQPPATTTSQPPATTTSQPLVTTTSQHPAATTSQPPVTTNNQPPATTSQPSISVRPQSTSAPPAAAAAVIRPVKEQNPSRNVTPNSTARLTVKLSDPVVVEPPKPMAPAFAHAPTTTSQPTVQAVPSTSGSSSPRATVKLAQPLAAKPNPASISWVKLKGKALEDHTSSDRQDLNFSSNDVILVTKQDNGGWWFGSNDRTGSKGWFPGFKVKLENPYLR
ncbi:hypothetical protein PROFUN_05027 [Planoprotostelium fungivorum]|uniref:Uncharacterized protein n=1 Tax=Planoprotostelium fungivorum TaxID=1890364 RepID=A0A2P6NSA7_9EUKA|nr:hypothetical protein PROFUN_05027 [Planoprotostelium fungivorum]